MAELRRRIPRDVAADVRLVVLDVDGVLTDGGIYVGATASGERVDMQRFEITDGLGIHLMQEAGIEVAIVTGRDSPPVALRALDLKITECHRIASATKLPTVEQLLERYEVEWNQMAFLSDDLADIPVLKRVGLPAAVANAVPEVRSLALWVGRRPGGHGAVREFAEALLEARGEWSRRVAEYIRQREEVA